MNKIPSGTTPHLFEKATQKLSPYCPFLNVFSHISKVESIKKELMGMNAQSSSTQQHYVRLLQECVFIHKEYAQGYKTLALVSVIGSYLTSTPTVGVSLALFHFTIFCATLLAGNHSEEQFVSSFINK
jgi:TctA family transporter